MFRLDDHIESRADSEALNILFDRLLVRISTPDNAAAAGHGRTCEPVVDAIKGALTGLLVTRHGLGLTGAAAALEVTARIVDRLEEAAASARRIPDAAELLGLLPRRHP
ncbi:hypothetical protein ACFWIA_35050 [Streptomyces sp. NPDC127068]|uniref:hypothetical protein n=1 Tax=Streptomyces sp. NPDC127068 TaxID=3347127 RepID=UPI003646310A